jgi:hypothetical protein
MAYLPIPFIASGISSGPELGQSTEGDWICPHILSDKVPSDPPLPTKKRKNQATYIDHLSDAHEMPRQFGTDQAWVVGQRNDAFIAISSGELFGEENVTLDGLVSMREKKSWTVRGMGSWVARSEREEEGEKGGKGRRHPEGNGREDTKKK